MDIAGKLDQYFLVGFLAPALALVALNFGLLRVAGGDGVWTALGSPGGAEATSLAVLTAFLAMALSAINRSVVRLYEGYPLVPWLRRWTSHQRRVFRHKAAELERVRSRLDAAADGAETRRDEARANALQFELSTRFPPHEHLILPTRLGNAIRAFEQRPQERYQIEPIVFWARLLGVIPESFAAELRGARSFFDFLLNLVLVAQVFAVELVLVGSVLDSFEMLAAAGICASLSYGLYRAAIGAAVEWGAAFTAAFDLYRRDLMSRLGCKPPSTVKDERRRWQEIGAFLIWNENDELAFDAQPADGSGDSPADRPT